VLALSSAGAGAVARRAPIVRIERAAGAGSNAWLAVAATSAASSLRMLSAGPHPAAEEGALDDRYALWASMFAELNSQPTSRQALCVGALPSPAAGAAGVSWHYG